MPKKGVSMHKVREILRLYFEANLSQDQIALSLSLSKGAVNKYLKRANAAQLSHARVKEMSEQDLRDCLCGPKYGLVKRYVEPNWTAVHVELKSKGMTLLLLWEEYKAVHIEKSYSYAQYCRYYRSWALKQKPSMRQVHKAGDKLFIDYCGPTIDIIDSETGGIRGANIFVATLGASNYTYAEATWDQKLPNWIASHVRAFAFFGGVPALLVPDNLKSAINKACRYEPEINSSYADLARFYGTAILPARPYKPKDKAKVENAVLVVERWILARLRHLTFFGLQELNIAISKLLVELNERPFKKMEGSRKSHFESIDKPALRSLPMRSYEYGDFRKCRVNIDYHVEVNSNYYSVPYILVKKEIEIRLSASTIECFYQGERIASHQRSHSNGMATTCTEHMPKAHQKHLEWTPNKMLTWGREIGPSTLALVKILVEETLHPEKGYRSCLGLISLAREYGAVRLEAGCKMSLKIGAPTRRSVASILRTGLDKQTLHRSEEEQEAIQINHENVRGAAHYNSAN